MEETEESGRPRRFAGQSFSQIYDLLDDNCLYAFRDDLPMQSCPELVAFGVGVYPNLENSFDSNKAAAAFDHYPLIDRPDLLEPHEEHMQQVDGVFQRNEAGQLRQYAEVLFEDKYLLLPIRLLIHDIASELFQLQVVACFLQL